MTVSNLSSSEIVSMEFPECWKDDVRMNALFAPFRSSGANPADRDSKIKFWTSLIERRCELLGRPSFTPEELETAFRRNEKTPACLSAVLDHALRSGIIAERDGFVRNDTGGWIEWGLRKTTSAAGALVSRMLPPKRLPSDARLVHKECLRKLAVSFLNSIPSSGRIGSASELSETSKLDQKFDTDTLMLLFDWLIMNNLAMRSDDGVIFKLAADEKTKVAPLTDLELCSRRLIYTKNRLKSSISNIENAILNHRNSAKLSLSKNNKSIAMIHLKKKKLLEIRLVKISNSLESIMQLYDTIEETNSDAEIIEAYKIGIRTLKNNMKEKGLDEDQTYNMMDDLKEVLEEYKNIEAAISQPIEESIDMDELEAELESLSESPNDNDTGNVNLSKDNDIESLLPDLSKLNVGEKESNRNSDIDAKNMETNLTA